DRDLEQCLHPGSALAGADDVATDSLAEHCPECIQQDRLPRPGLTGKRVEARLEPDGRAFDNSQIGDVEFDQHAGSAFQSTTSRNGSCLTHQLCPPEPPSAKRSRK